MRFGRVQYRTHFRAVIRAKYSACFSSMRAMVVSSWFVLEGFIPFLRSCPHIASVSWSAPSRCEFECFQGSRDCPILVTPISLQAAMLLAEHVLHKRGELPEFPTGVLSQHCITRIMKADGSYGLKSHKMNRIARKSKKTAHPQTQISPTKPAHEIQRLKASSLSKAKPHGEHERNTGSKKCTTQKF